MKKTREIPEKSSSLTTDGDPIADHAGLIDEWPRNAYEIAQAIWGT